MGPFALTRPRRLRSPISLAPMIDILMILLIFFMVTSSFLDLDMIPAVPGTEAPVSQTQATGPTGGPLLIRIGADGLAAVRGQALSPEALGETLRAALAQAPGLRVIVLPSASAPVQALVSVLDTATAAGVQGVQVVRLEAP